MTILAIADRGPKKSIREIISANHVDLLITLGDLDMHEIRELEMIENIPKVGVYGNHSSGTYFEPLGIMNLHLKTWEYQDLVFGGFEGSLKYKESEYAKMYTQQEADELLKDFPKVDVMISHSPPFGINDEPESSSHAGFEALSDYLKEKKPSYFLHGHTYPTNENLVSQFMETKIIYVYQEKIIKI